MKLQYILNFLVIVCLVATTNLVGYSQDEVKFPAGEKGYEATYQRNIKKSRINGVYIPKDLEEAFEELDNLSPEGAKAKFKNAPEDIIASKLHFGLGRWISVYWNFIEGSRYVEYLRTLGLTDHDHMIQFTIVSYHRYMNDRPQEIDTRVAEYKKQREAYLEELKGRRTLISKETRKIERGE